MCFASRFPRPQAFNTSLVVSLALLASGAIYAQNSDSSDVSALKARMQEMQRQYEDRISTLDAKMQAFASKTDSGSILNTHVLADADGKEYEGKGPALDESFLKSLTRNFTFSAYVRTGVMFNGSGGGGDFHFEIPDNEGGRSRLGNENDTYMELTFSQAHMLGDSPDLMDVSMTFTPVIRYSRNRNTFVTGIGGGQNGRENGSDFEFAPIRQVYVEMSNVFKAAPEITFWGGERFYRFGIDPMDYFWLDMSGYGAGVKNINLGIGQLYVAYLAGLDNDFTSPTDGSFYKHSLDVEWRHIPLGPGDLMIVGIASYEKGTTFTRDFNGNTLRNPIHTSDAFGLGAGALYQFDLSAIGPKSFLQLYALAGFGATNFRAGTDIGELQGFDNAALVRNPFVPAGALVNAGNAIQNQRAFRAGSFFVWNPTPCFSLGIWAFWLQDSAGFRQWESFPNPVFPTAIVLRNTAGTRNLYEAGFRPYVWITDNIAIQAQIYGGYIDNVRGFEASSNPTINPGTLSPTAFGRSGAMGVFTIAPTIKPKGGFFTRPELRVFATFSIWSDSLKGSTTSIQEGGNVGGFSPAPYAHSNQGWLLGTQAEWYF